MVKATIQTIVNSIISLYVFTISYSLSSEVQININTNFSNSQDNIYSSSYFYSICYRNINFVFKGVPEHITCLISMPIPLSFDSFKKLWSYDALPCLWI